MNIFHKSTRQSLCLLLVMLLNSSLNALTFRNEPLTNFIESGKLLYADFPENSFVILELENDNFDVYGGNINELHYLHEVFEEVMALRGACISSKICNISSNTINYNSSYLVGCESMNITVKTALNLIGCRLESPMISITGSTMNFVDSFLINPEVMNIIIDHPGSAYESIQIIFYTKAENPTVITGKIDLESDERGRRLIISNVKEIRMQFAWDKIVVEHEASVLSDADENTSTSLESSDEISQEAMIEIEDEGDAITSNEEIAVEDADELMSSVGLYETLEDATVAIEKEEVIINPKEETIVASINEEATKVRSNSKSHSTLSGFVAQSRQVIVAFYKKYITPYL